MGPQTYNNVGNETYPTVNRLLKGTGNEHVGDSIVSEIGEGIGISGSLSVTGSMTASSSVGIGGASPTYRLTVYNASNGTTAAFGGTARGIRIDNDGTFSSGRSTIFGVDNSFYGSYQPMSIEASSLSLQVLSGGNVGIGTTSVSGTYEKLAVAGGISIKNDNNAKLEIGRYSAGVPNSYIKLGPSSNSLIVTNNIDAADIFAIQNAGNVGIGIVNPSTKLHIQDNFDPDDTLGYVLVENTNTTSGAAATNSSLNVKNYHGTSQFMQWQSFGLRIGSRILTNGGVGDVIFTAGADSEKMRLLAGGGLTFNGDTAAANALDDYEEGTWTPRLTGGAGEATYTSRRGWYTKIGRQVTVIWQIYFQKNNMSGTMRMNDLPFTLLSDNSAFYPQGTVLMDTLASVVNNITFQPGNGSNSGDFIQGNGGTLNHEGFSISNLSNSTMLTRGTVTYFT
jgi:hypothetical protein